MREQHEALDLYHDHGAAELHHRLFERHSEWDSNPFLWGEECRLLDQASYFLNWCHDLIHDEEWRNITSLTRRLLAFRFEGPDQSVVIQQRLLGMYGSAGAPAPDTLF